MTTRSRRARAATACSAGASAGTHVTSAAREEPRGTTAPTGGRRRLARAPGVVPGREESEGTIHRVRSHRRRDLHGFRPVGRGRADDRARVVDRERREEAEARLVESEQVAERRKDDERDRVQGKTVARATDTDSGFARIAGAPPRWRSAADRRPRRHEDRRVFLSAARERERARRRTSARCPRPYPNPRAPTRATTPRSPRRRAHDRHAEEDVREAFRGHRPRVPRREREDDPEDERPPAGNDGKETCRRQQRDEDTTGGHGRECRLARCRLRIATPRCRPRRGATGTRRAATAIP